MSSALAQQPCLNDWVTGTYDCRLQFWERAKALDLQNLILTRLGAKLLERYYEGYLGEPSYETFMLWAENEGHHALKREDKRSKADQDFRRCQINIDERSVVWLADGKRWDSLAHCPVDWILVVAIRRFGIHNAKQLDEASDVDLLKVDGLGPGKLTILRSYAKKCSKLQREKNRSKVAHRPSRKGLQPALL